ncbi:DUF6503 family protein [Algoriphagus chordae]|uniref:Uncharacterized protein n=1 Tax=Algoriphagus chordae TaxID=237019 RepID=A0A2W7RCE4_9BACT|nr:DUF6503 family protein [Algoriphagus chordae]PZX48405.1 hypothetical protein LV85_03649 [Algoriphagus chordae]
MIQYLFLLLLVSACNTIPSGKEVLKESIQFHDPRNQWHKLQENIRVRSDFIYPDTVLNGIMIGLDNPNKLVSYYNLTYEQHIEFTESSCVVLEGDRSCDQMAWTKNFYHFILGLPMTLQNEEGIVQESVVDTTFHETASYRVAIDFEKEKWHFYFAKADYHLVGFASNKNFESKAEEIRTDDLIEIAGMKLPKTRSWWITTDSLAPIYSGTDEILGSSKWLKNENLLFE